MAPPRLTAAEKRARAEQRAATQRAIGQRLRRRRLESGHTAESIYRAIGISMAQYGNYEVGSRPYPVHRLAAIASAIGIPVASLLTDEVVLAEIRASSETLERVRREGRPAAREAALRIVDNLEALLLAEATRPPVDLSPGARAKPRRSREQKLASWAAATERSKAIAEERRQARKIA
jgi:transcriptional regulator with XRE-family HTH domain